MEKITYTVTDPNGIHARPAGLIVQTAKQYPCRTTMSCGERSADCKKLFGIMQMGVRAGDCITITADGEGCESALRELERTLWDAGL